MKKKKFSFKGLWEVLKDAFKSFGEDKITRLSGSLAYYTVFSMAPLLIVLMSLAGIFLGQEAVEGKIYETLDGFLGASAAAQLQETIKNASLEGKSTLAAVIGGLALVFGASTIFAQIQDSINDIWDVKAKPKKRLDETDQKQDTIFFPGGEFGIFASCVPGDIRCYRCAGK